MGIERVLCNGKYMVDKHTHYELTVSIGPSSATIIIGGHIEDAFKKKYGKEIKASTFYAELPFIRNDRRVKECQDPYKLPGHLMASVYSIDEISLDDTIKA